MTDMTSYTHILIDHDVNKAHNDIHRDCDLPCLESQIYGKATSFVAATSVRIRSYYRRPLTKIAAVVSTPETVRRAKEGIW